MYRIIEYGTNIVLAEFNGAQWSPSTLNAWCAENGYLPHHNANRRNWVVIRA